MSSRSLRKAVFTGAALCLSWLAGPSCSHDTATAPTLLRIAPDKAAAAGGIQVTITGSGFLPGASVYFADTPAKAVVGEGDFLMATVPAYNGPLGPVEVRVRNPDGGEAARNDLFSYVRVPIEFARTLTRKVGREPSAIIAADVNGDGGPELLVTSRADNTLTVLLHNEDYQSIGSPYPTATGPAYLALADINGDGQKDALVACNSASGQDLSVLRGSGNGSFIPPVNFAIGTATGGVTAGDFNGDGKVDVALSIRSAGKVSVLTNNSPGAAVSFAMPYASYNVGREPVAVLAYELSGDGRPDIISANYRDDQLGLLLSTATGGFQQPTQTMQLGTGPIGLAVGQLTSDTRPDIAAVNFDSATVTVLKAQGDGSFAKSATLPTAAKPIAVAIADMDQDGKQDLIVANSDANLVSVYLGNGDGSFDPAQTFPVGMQPWGITVADLDHNGLPDIATANLAGNDVTILFNRTGW